LVLGGRIYRGSIGGAGELGHTIVGLHLEGQDQVPTGDVFPQLGSLEAVGAGSALDRVAAETAKLYPESALGRIEAQGRAPNGVDAVEAAKAGDEEAGRTVEAWAERLGIGVANAINTFDPDEVVIGGGAINAGDLLLEPASRVAQAYIHPGLQGHARIRLARHGMHAGVLGAALLALYEVEDELGPRRRLVTEPTSREVS
jgi:glucokinase